MIAYIEDLKKHVGAEVRLRGWVTSKRGKVMVLYD